MENFKVFKGKIMIDFATPPDRNIILFDGKNGYGKTTLQTAIRYCLYGVESHRGERYDNINKYALREGLCRMMIQMHFTHRGKQYQLTRSVQAYPGDPRSAEESVSLLVDGILERNIENRIEEILPRDASQFFFFDGEQIRKYANVDDPVRMREAIELVLDIPAIRNGIDHLQKINTKVDRSMAAELRKDKVNNALAKDFERLGAEIAKYEEGIKGVKAAEIQLKKQLEDVENQLQKNEAVQEIMRTIDQNRREIANLEGQIQDVEKAEQEQLAILPYAVIRESIQKVHSKVAAGVKKFQDASRERARYEGIAQALEDLKEGGNCFCGTVIGKGEVRFILKLAEHYREKAAAIPSDERSELVYLQKLERILGRVESLKITLLELQRRKRELQFKIDDLSSENKTLDAKLQTVDIDAVKTLASERDELLQELARASADLEWHEQTLEQLKDQRDEKSREIAKLAPASDRLGFLDRLAQLADRTYRALKDYLEETIGEKKRQIEEEADIVHHRLTNKKDVYAKVRINDDYTISVFDRDGNEVPREKLSEGEKQILALSFIAGLSRATEREAPIIMDTPFGRLDIEHKTNVMNYLPRLGSQVAILATDTDVNEENIDLISPYIGKSYAILFDPKVMSSTIEKVAM